MGRFAGDPDFAGRWPRDVLVDEIARLVSIGARDGLSGEWSQEVELLLEQAFESTVPLEGFRRMKTQSWDFDEDPF